jgi:hypothetical protein
MPITYTIDPDALLVRFRYEGDVGIDEFETTLTAVVADRDFVPGFSLLLDRRGAASPTREYIRRAGAFAKAQGERLGPGRWAIVVDSAETYARVSMGQILVASFIELEIFTDIRDAEAWLRGER